MPFIWAQWPKLAFAAVAIFVVTFLIRTSINAQQPYEIMPQVAQAATFGQNAANAVAAYEQEHQKVPNDLEQAGFAKTLPAVVQKIGFDSQRRAVVVTMSNMPVEGKTLLIVPSKGANGKAMWKCMSQEIQEEYLPPGCR